MSTALSTISEIVGRTLSRGGLRKLIDVRGGADKGEAKLFLLVDLFQRIQAQNLQYFIHKLAIHQDNREYLDLQQ